MVTRCEVELLKSLESVCVDVRLVKAFVEANGNGKSNLLEAVGGLGLLRYFGAAVGDGHGRLCGAGLRRLACQGAWE